MICPNFKFATSSWHVELGVLSWRLDADNYETDEELKKIREDRGYSYMVCHSNSQWFMYLFLTGLWENNFSSALFFYSENKVFIWLFLL